VLAHVAGIPVEEALLAAPALLAGVTVIAGRPGDRRAPAPLNPPLPAVHLAGCGDPRWRGAREHRRIQAKAGWVFDAVHDRSRLEQRPIGKVWWCGERRRRTHRRRDRLEDGLSPAQVPKVPVRSAW